MKYILFLLTLLACDSRSVMITNPSGASVAVKTSSGFTPAEVSVLISPITLVPVILPQLIPVRVGCTAEKP